MKLEDKIDIGLIDANKVGLLIWGTKSGYRTLLDKNIKPGQILSSNQNFLEEITSLYKEDLFVINPHEQGKSSFAIKKFKNCNTYIKYVNIYENNQQSNRSGFYSISIFINNQSILRGEHVVNLLNKLDEIFSRNFLSLGNYRRKYINDNTITFDKFSSLIDAGIPSQTSYERVTNEVETEMYKYEHISEVALIFDYLNEFNIAKFTYITQKGVNLIPYTKDTTEIIRAVKEKKATRQIEFHIYSKRTKEPLEGSISLQYEGKNTSVEISQGASTKSLVINKSSSPIDYEITNIAKVGHKTPPKARTTLQEIQCKGNKFIIEVEEKPCFIFTVNHNSKKLSLSDYELEVLGGEKSILKNGDIKVYPYNVKEAVEIEVIPNNNNWGVYKNKFTLTKPVERQEISIKRKPIIKINVLDGRRNKISDKSSYQLIINGTPFKGSEINLDDYSSETIDFKCTSHFYGIIVTMVSKKELLGEYKIDIRFDKIRNVKEFKWMVKDKESGRRIEGVQYQIHLRNGFPVPSGSSDQYGLIEGKLFNKDNSDVRPEDVQITLTKAGYHFPNKNISSFYVDLEMEAKKKKVTISFKNDPEVLKKLKKVNYKHPKQTRSKFVNIKDRKIVIEFPHNYDPEKGDKLEINIGANQVGLREKPIIIDLLKNKHNLFFNYSYEIELKEKPKISKKTIITAALALFIISALGFGVYHNREIIFPSSQSASLTEVEPTTDNNEVVSDGGPGGQDPIEKPESPSQGLDSRDSDAKPDSSPKDTGSQAPKVESKLPPQNPAAQVTKVKGESPPKDAGGQDSNNKTAKKEELIQEIMEEIKTKNFKTNVEEKIDEKETELKKEYGHIFDPATQNKIRVYKETAHVVFRLNHPDNFPENELENIIEENFSQLMTYADCNRKYYTPDQAKFLETFRSDKMTLYIRRFSDTFKPKSRDCSSLKN